jgi:uncharacterized lipoprotein YmbA
MRSVRLTRSNGVLVTFLLLSASCTILAPQPDPTEFFVLRSRSQLAGTGGVNAGASAARVAVGVGPIQLPEYLDRPQLVRRHGGNRLEIAETRRWAEPLQSGFARVLAENLSELLAVHALAHYPWSSGAVDYGVRVEVSRFEPTNAGMAELSARWFIREEASRRLVRSHEAKIQTPIAAPGAEGSVKALSEALGELSGDIAAAIRELPPVSAAKPKSVSGRAQP